MQFYGMTCTTEKKLQKTPLLLLQLQTAVYLHKRRRVQFSRKVYSAHQLKNSIQMYRLTDGLKNMLGFFWHHPSLSSHVMFPLRDHVITGSDNSLTIWPLHRSFPIAIVIVTWHDRLSIGTWKKRVSCKD